MKNEKMFVLKCDVGLYKKGTQVKESISFECSGLYMFLLGNTLTSRVYFSPNNVEEIDVKPEKEHSNVWHSINNCEGIRKKKKKKALKLIETLEDDNSLAKAPLGHSSIDLGAKLVYAFSWATYGPSFTFWNNIDDKINK